MYELQEQVCHLSNHNSMTQFWKSLSFSLVQITNWADYPQHIVLHLSPTGKQYYAREAFSSACLTLEFQIIGDYD